MTLEEAIERTERAYKESRNGLQYALKRGETRFEERCKKEAEENRQLAEWLRELKERREEPEVTYCKDCVNRTRCTQSINVYTLTGTDTARVTFCSRGKRPERRTE